MNHDETEQHVSTESQRLALEAMSSQLVHKLNAMISEQEERARRFAEQHHSTLPTPQQFTPTVPEYTPPAAEPPVTSAAPAPRQKPVPPPPATRRPEPQPTWNPDYRSPAETARKPLRTTPRKKTAKEEEEGNIGAGMIITIIIAVIILMRACS